MIPLKSQEQSNWFSERLHPCEDLLRAWLHSRFPGIRDVDDIIQSAYLKILAAYEESGLEMKSPQAFLFATARNLAIDIVRREKIVRFEPIVESDPSFVLENAAQAKKAVSRKDDLELMTEAIQSLPDRCRQVFTLRKVYGYSHQEIASQLGISPNTVAVQASKGLRLCKDFIKGSGEWKGKGAGED